jgi:hypothetical protein
MDYCKIEVESKERKMDHQELLNALIGEWTGSGRGEYPTIEPFEYVEALRFSSDDRSIIHYEQKTRRWEIRSEAYIASHWENGFIRLLADGRVQINNTQSGGRTEVLTGSLEGTENEFIIRLQSTSFLNDPHMQESSRTITVAGDSLHYTMYMRTNSTPEMSIHLEARLTRQS